MVDNTLHLMITVRLDEPGSPPKAKALAMTLGRRSLMLIGLDLGGAGTAHAGALREAVSRATGLDVEDVVVSCTHTHSAAVLEPLDGEHPYFDLVVKATVDAAAEAWDLRRPAGAGHGLTCVAGASFNTRVPLPNGGVKFTRDYREGLASGRPVDPRLSVLRIDDENGSPIAGWVRFATHPACVIFNAPVSAEYPGYMTDQVSETVAGGAPVLFGFGAAGDVNCVPMFGTEQDARNLGLNLAALAGPVFENIQTRAPKQLLSSSCTLQLPLNPIPSAETLDREIAEVAAFVEGLDENPDLVWVLGVNCCHTWSVAQKKAAAMPLGKWAERTKAAIAAGKTFPTTWPAEITAWIIDDLGMVFYPGEPFTEIGLTIASRSPLADTLVMSHCNGMAGYLATDEERRRGGYEPCTWHRSQRDSTQRPMSYALGAADVVIDGCIELINGLIKGK